MSGEDGGQGPQSPDEVFGNEADAFGPLNTVVDPRGAAAAADGGDGGTASSQPGAATPEPPPVPIPEETKAFDDFLTSDAIKADESLAIGAAVAATREQIATLNDKLTKASEEDKPSIEEEKASLEKTYKEQLGELNTALQGSIAKDKQEINDLCTQHHQHLQTVVNMTPEAVEQIAHEPQKNAVNEIRKKQAALDEKKRYQQQIADDTLPEPAPRPQVPQKLKDKGEEAALESDVSAKERPSLNQETEPAQFDPMNASVLYNMILLLISEKSPTRYLLAATCLVAARVLNKPVEAVQGSVCLLCATMSLAYSKDQAKEWLSMAVNHGVQALPYELLTPHASSQELAQAMYQMLENEQSKAMLPRRLLELAMDRGMSNKATDDLSVAPKGSAATLEPNIPNQQAGAPGATLDANQPVTSAAPQAADATLGANQPVTPAPVPSTAASLEAAVGPQPSPSVASSATTSVSTSPSSASLGERSGNLRTAANAEPPGGLSQRGTATGLGMNTAQVTQEALTERHPEFAAAAANKEPAAQEEKQRSVSPPSTTSTKRINN